MKIAMLASECNPFAKTGGLADVAYSLSKELSHENEVILVMPLYKMMWNQPDFAPVLVTTFPIYMGWRRQQVDLYRLERDGITFYFAANAYYFDRDGFYGFYDDGERFAYLSVAFAEILKNISFQPDIVHVHDWQGGMVPVLLKKRYGGDPFFAKTKSVITIHNPAFKGYLYPESLGDLFGLSDDLFYDGSVRYEGMVSTLKAGIMYADKITTVSPTHRQELLGPALSHGLDGSLRLREYDFVGIANGVDTEMWNPETDPYIAANYSIRNRKSGKAKNRAALLERFHLRDYGGPVYGLVSRLTNQKGIDLILQTYGDVIAPKGGVLVVLGSGDPHLEAGLETLRSYFSESVGIYIGYEEKLAHLIYAGSDFFLMPSLFEPCGISQMIAQRYGTPPIVRKTGGLADTVQSWPESKNPDGIAFLDFNKEGLSYGIENSFATYHAAKAYDDMARNAMKCDHSWKEAAASYLALYQEALSK